MKALHLTPTLPLRLYLGAGGQQLWQPQPSLSPIDQSRISDPSGDDCSPEDCAPP